MSNKKLTRSEIYKIRYHIYRQAGYSPTEASKLRGRKLDIEDLRLKNGQIPYKHKTFKRLVEMVKNIKDIDDFSEKINDFRRFYNENVVGDKNDTKYTSWGAITHDERYEDRTAKLVEELQKRHNLSVNQGYYMLYMMTTHGMSYKTAVSELLTSQEFEIYRQSKTLKPNRKRKL